MLKHILTLILLSLLAILFAQSFSLVIGFIHFLYEVLLNFSAKLFAHTSLGQIAAKTISLILVPLLITSLPALIYWLITRREVNYFYFISWLIWIILITTIVWR